MARKKTNKSDLDEELEIIKKERDNILNFKINFKCKTKHQKEFLKAVYKNDINFISGAPGSGKSICSLFVALDLLKNGATNGYQRIVLVYPVAVNDQENVGFLAGTLQQKLQPFQEPDFYNLAKIINEGSDKNGEEIVKKLVEAGKLEVRSSSFLRGANLDYSLIIVAEAQNFSKESLLKILTRIGTNSKIILNYDIYQLDNSKIKSGRSMSGVQYAKKVLSGMKGISFTEFGLEDVVRNDVIPELLKRWIPDVYGDLDLEEVEKLHEESLIIGNEN